MLKSVELNGFKSFGKKSELVFDSAIAAIVGPNGSGKCMTGDTLLWRKCMSGDRYESIRIDCVGAGDMVASYDEQSRTIVPRTVRARVAQGIREVYKITTEGGHSIRATGNHPFLVGGKWVHAEYLRVSDALSIRKSPIPRIGVFVDNSNLYHAQKKAGWYTDIEKMKNLFAGMGELVCINYHVALPRTDDTAYRGMQKHIKGLEKIVTVKTKPLKYITAPGQDHPLKKGDVDVELVIDAIEQIEKIDIAIIVSGDSDFAELERFLRERGKGVVFVAHRQSMAWELRLKKHIFLEDIREHVERTLTLETPNPRLAPRAISINAIIHDALTLSNAIPFQGVDMIGSEPIAAIKKAGREAVWDVEIDGTHTFIANDIVVHNSNVAEGLRFVLGEQSMKSLRSKRGEDLIWGGSHTVPRMNRASVKVVFDNREHRLDIDFPEVVLERVVYRDGQNEYLMNGTKVRLKDVIRLLAGANIGGSGYQIISQGEADRILNASPRERREMVEDALGLKLYQHKKAESERKLEETSENIEKVESLRRELAPHLKFLGKQVEKIEKAKELKGDLAHQLADYLAREHAWIAHEGARLKEEDHALKNELTKVRLEVGEADRLKGPHEGALEESHAASDIRRLEEELRVVRATRDELSRELGRAEGALEAASRMGEGEESPVARREAEEFADSVAGGVDAALGATTLEDARGILQRTKSVVANFLQKIRSGTSGIIYDTTREHEKKRDTLAKEVSIAVHKEADIVSRLQQARENERTAREAVHAAERSILSLESRAREIETKLGSVSHAHADVARSREQFEAEVREGIALIGAAVHGWEKGDVPQGALSEDRGAQEKRRRDIERLKIKIEEYGGGGSGEDVLKEYDQTRERDEFLGRELGDLVASEQNLRQLIEELDAQMDQRFTEGLKKINEALQVFFERLFNGGSAKLELERPTREEKMVDDGEAEEPANERLTKSLMEREAIAGLAISVSLPRKKVRGLEVLSGGERALTSIAMIFAMSQVNPPPFLILDETDAALDEANSKRYADMIVHLAERSQLIVITHNRATMSAAGELYGVTMGADGVSKLLSVKLEEAERVAK